MPNVPRNALSRPQRSTLGLESKLQGAAHIPHSGPVAAPGPHFSFHLRHPSHLGCLHSTTPVWPRSLCTCCALCQDCPSPGGRAAVRAHQGTKTGRGTGPVGSGTSGPREALSLGRREVHPAEKLLLQPPRTLQGGPLPSPRPPFLPSAHSPLSSQGYLCEGPRPFLLEILWMVIIWFHVCHALGWLCSGLHDLGEGGAAGAVTHGAGEVVAVLHLWPQDALSPQGPRPMVPGA